MTRLAYLLFISCLLLSTLGCSTGSGPDGPDLADEPNGIYWDKYGVPHIKADTFPDAYYAQGYAMAKNHGDLILRLFGESRGRAAEYWGQANLQHDQYMHRMNVPARSEERYTKIVGEEKELLDSFVAGANAYLNANLDKITDKYEVVLPITPIDVLNHEQRVLLFTFVVNLGQLGGAVRQFSAGSNAYAVAPKRTESGNALLVANPHLPWRDFFLFTETHMMVGDTNIYGSSLVGFPGISIGFNQHLGWTHTVNTHDGYDLYRLKLKDNGYVWGDEVAAFTERKVTLKIKQDDGTHREEELITRESAHGPVIADKDGSALAVRVVGLGESHLIGQYINMMRATNLSEFETALKQLQMPMFTVMYADKEGHIMHLFGGKVPKRSDGGWGHWSGIVPGDSPDNLWTEVHPYEELPKVLDPESGWLQNANDPPWTTTFPLAINPDDYPPYMAPQSMAFRPQSSARMLAEDDKISFEEMLNYKHDSRMTAAERIMDDLAEAVEKHGDDEAKAAMKVLQSWDGQANADSKGAVLFANWAMGLMRATRGDMFAVPWQKEKPRTTPSGLKDPAQAAAVLSQAAAGVRDKYGAVDVPWGDVYRFRVADADYPANGGPGQLGCFRVMVFTEDQDDKWRVVHGDTFTAVVEFGEKVRAQTLTSYGNATQPGSPHRTDQLPLLAEQKLRKTLFYFEDVKAETALEEVNR